MAEDVVRYEEARVPGAHMTVACRIIRADGRYRSTLFVGRDGKSRQWQQDWIKPNRAMDVLVTHWMTEMLVPEIVAHFKADCASVLKYELGRLLYRQPEPKPATRRAAQMPPSVLLLLAEDPGMPDMELHPIPEELRPEGDPAPLPVSCDTQEIIVADVLKAISLPADADPVGTGPLMVETKTCVDGYVVHVELTIIRRGGRYGATLSAAVTDGPKATRKFRTSNPAILLVWVSGYDTAKALTTDMGLQDALGLSEFLNAQCKDPITRFALRNPPDHSLTARMLDRIEDGEEKRLHPTPQVAHIIDGQVVNLP